LSPQKSAIVIGGGITGLAAALRLHEKGFAVTLLEAAPRIGGAINTVTRDGFTMETGPDSFITQKPAALALIKRLGLEGEVTGTNPEFRNSYILRGGKLRTIPEGFFLLAPARWLPFMLSPLLSIPGKMRAGMDLILPRGPVVADESLASFVTRRLGHEVFDWLAQPLVSGIYTADASTLSLRATFPAFLELERKYRSIILGLRLSQTRATSAASGARYSLFATMRNGLTGLVEAIASRLPTGAIRCNSSVMGIRRTGTNWTIALRNGDELSADAVIVAVPAPAASTLMSETDLELSKLLGKIPYASTATVTVGFNRSQVAHHLRGFGFVVPHAEGRRLLACTFSNVKFPVRATPDRVLLRMFIGGATDPEVARMEPDAIARMALKDLREILGITGEPIFTETARYPGAMPQYLVGHLTTVSGIREREKILPGLALAGNAYEGLGLPDCIKSGEEAAERLAGENSR